MTWLYIPSRSAQESECLTKACEPDVSFLASSNAPFVTLKGKPLQPQRLLKTWNRESWIKRLSGLTLSPLTAQRGADAWIASLPVSRANLTQSLANAKARTMKDGSGKTSPESSATFLLGSFFLKTSGVYFPVEGSRQSSHRWSPSGSILSGEYWPRPKLEPVTNVSVFSYWPTVTVCGNYNRRGLTKTSGDGLQTFVKNWATPTATDYKRGNYPGDHRRKTPCLAAQVHCLPQALAQTNGAALSPTHRTLPRRLNPMFVCWLMGWPIWWTHPEQIKSAPAEMELYRYKLQLHLSHLFSAQEFEEAV